LVSVEEKRHTLSHSPVLVEPFRFRRALELIDPPRLECLQRIRASGRRFWSFDKEVPVPNIGYYHPMLVHFTVALLITGVVFRLISLTGRVRFTGPAATTLLLVGTAFAFVAVRSGTDAHGPAERIPGARSAVEEHEEYGEEARNVFAVVALLEIAGLFLAGKKKEKLALAASAIVGLVGLVYLYEAAEHGGSLVYSYAGGIGTRTGNEHDVERLLLAGIYQQAQTDRAAGNHADAAALIALAKQRHPQDPEIQLLAAQSLLLDKNDPQAALDALDQIDIPNDNARLRIQRGFLAADALEASGNKAEARSRLEALQEEFPNNGRLRRRLDELR
jgi:uncharacterized membrane protein